MLATERDTGWKVDLPEGAVGNVSVRKFTVPENSFENFRLSMSGRGIRPGDYTALYRGETLWMSDTTAEARDHYAPYSEMIHRGGRVLIVGLGLGMIVRKALELPNVEHVDVVEIDPDVVALVGPAYAGERCTIHEADIFNMTWPKGVHWTTAWFDIWPTICEDHLPEMARLGRSYGRKADWKGYWGKEEALYSRRRNAASRWW